FHDLHTTTCKTQMSGGGAGCTTLRFLTGGIPRSLTAWDFSLTFELTDSWSNTMVFIIDRSRKQGEKDGVPGSPPVAERGGVRDLELGKAVERVRVVWRSRLRFLRNRSRAQVARGWAAMVET